MDEKLFHKFQGFRASLNGPFLERQTIIDGVLACLLTKQNCFLFGAPGTGKSELVREVSNGFKGSKFFNYLLSPTTDPSELFGPVRVSKLLKDEYTRDVEGYLPSANIAFLDELFRGSSAVLNSLLTILNERTFNNGRNIVETPIQSIVAATNSFPQEESLQAFCDRFLFRPTVHSLKLAASKGQLDQWALGLTPRPNVVSELTFDDLVALQSEVGSVTISEDFLDSFTGVLTLLSSRGLDVSDRRRVQILKFMRGWAVVQGTDELIPDHLHGCLEHIIYRNQDDIPLIKECLDQAVPTIGKVLSSIKRAANGIETEYHALVKAQLTNPRRSPLEALNETVGSLRRLHKNQITLNEKLDSILEGGKYRVDLQSRQSATKLSLRLETLSSSIAKTLNELTS